MAEFTKGWPEVADSAGCATLVQDELFGHWIVPGGTSLAVYVLSSGKFTLIVDALTIEPWAGGRWYADMSMMMPSPVIETAGPGTPPYAHFPFRSNTVSMDATVEIVVV